MKRCIVTYANATFYPGGIKKGNLFYSALARLEKNLATVGYADKFISCTSDRPYGGPTHQEVPYCFKYIMLDQARRQGFDLVFWFDVSVVPVYNLDPLFYNLESHRHGVSFYETKHNHGIYTNTRCLNAFRISRKQSFAMRQLASGIMGYNFRHPMGNEVLDELLWYIHNKPFVFHDDEEEYENFNNNEILIKHRHDQAVLTCMSHIKKIASWQQYKYYEPWGPLEIRIRRPN
jgi:hypothetical protein